ncbi:hypothetical protein BJ122_11636 [Rhodopseudomonas faecalis]|uniref:Uncharacterized protein n=1 Tax=Rhodopseudomonas faecalis TaxID=99655 RepID=A0A318TB72_9BRAD|nr:hypothetical protein [Rhodopseudomonas faecalis]PYF01904.1 hypothetical protein BJ122_11636 [Rhodopseudomonas faecalis]TAH66700.1 MAG: hypothetical protein EWM45_10555 [Rhodopseudomonas palustris]
MSTNVTDRAMDETIARLNIDHYRRLLDTEPDEIRRKAILRRMDEEQSKLERKLRSGAIG